MAAALGSDVLDNGLIRLRSVATNIRICANATEPTTYALATGATSMVGVKTWGTSAAFTAPAALGSTARQAVSVLITDGTILTSASAGWWAVTDETNSVLLAHGTLSAATSVSSGSNFSLAAFSIAIPFS